MAYSATQIANFFILKGLEEGVKVDPLKVQKLVYFAHGWHLYFHKSPLIRDGIEAWRYGPVVPNLYYAYRKFGTSTIKETAPEPEGCLPLDERTNAFLGQIWKSYGRYTGLDLSMMTHEPGYAWDMTRRENATPWNDAVINNALIQDEFSRRKNGGG